MGDLSLKKFEALGYTPDKCKGLPFMQKIINLVCSGTHASGTRTILISSVALASALKRVWEKEYFNINPFRSLVFNNEILFLRKFYLYWLGPSNFKFLQNCS